MNGLKKEIHRYLRILELDNIKFVEMNEKLTKDYLIQRKKFGKTKVDSRNPMNSTSTFLRNSGSFLK